MKTRPKDHRRSFPNVYVEIDKFFDVRLGHYIVQVYFKCSFCGEWKRRDFRDLDEYPMARAHIWLGRQLPAHSHREQVELALG